MKNIIKLLAALTFLASFSIAKAQTVVSQFTTNETRSVITNSIVINSLQISATSSGPFILQLIDNSVASLTYTNAAYTNVLAYTTNLVTTFVGATGVTNSYTNLVLYTDRIVTVANTNTITPLANLAVNANESLFVPGPFICAKGLVIRNLSNAISTNSVGGTVIVSYRNP